MSRLRAAVRRRTGDDAGMSLVELIVSMGIFTIVISIFMAGVAGMARSTARAQAVGDAGDAVRNVFQRMDREFRYAAAINRPGQGGVGTYYVESLTTAVPVGLNPLCTQWRYVTATRTLEMRSWRTGAASAGSWRIMADDVRNDLTDPARRPFAFTPAGPVYQRQQLRVLLDVGPGPAGPNERVGAELDSTFVARNSSTSSQSNRDDDANGQSDTPVCLNFGRP